MLRLLCFMTAILLVTACSGKQMYRVGQDYQKSNCAQNVISLEQYDECMKTNRLSYEDYEKEREAVIKVIAEEKNELY